MPLVIDGWNFIRNKRSDIIEDAESLDAARTLIAYLASFQKSHNDPVLVVFDSKREFLETGFQNTPKLRIIPAKNADRYIKNYLDDTPEQQRKNIRVVSSDKEIFYYARSCGAAPIKCEDFWEKLYGDFDKP